MTPKTKKRDGEKPATKADVAKVSDNVARVADDVARVADDVDGLAIATKNTFDRIETKMATRESQERILSIVQSIDQHFKEHRDLPRKVERLEVDVFKLQTRPR